MANNLNLTNPYSILEEFKKSEKPVDLEIVKQVEKEESINDEDFLRKEDIVLKTIEGKQAFNELNSKLNLVIRNFLCTLPEGRCIFDEYRSKINKKYQFIQESRENEVQALKTELDESKQKIEELEKQLRHKTKNSNT